jgi:glutamate formiminotransferase
MLQSWGGKDVNQIVECVPNFSEGRRLDVIDQIVAAMSQTPAVQVLDVQSDLDHNRSVVTLIGEPQPMVEAVFQGVAKASELIDMDHHRGGHPRMGATDVVPFVPVRGVTMEDCAGLARQLGGRVGAELGIPVYLYEAAATRPERIDLAAVRRGEYEELRQAIATDPNRVPDYGPARLSAAGATAIGARPPLIAFNVYLNTDDVKPAQAIARAVRHSSGGLRFVKALGLLVEDQAQISMNITDYHRTPLHRVLELIRTEAARYGLGVTHSEVVGLLPAQALYDAAQFYLQAHSLSPEQILENWLSDGD